MIAFAWPWAAESASPPGVEASRLAASLCTGLGGIAAAVDIDGLCFARRDLAQSPASRNWRPALLADGSIAVFHGYFDNAATIATELGVDGSDQAFLYGSAVAAWGVNADRHIIGEYCALVVAPDCRSVRLSRSPLRAPPLTYHHDNQLVAAASVPHAIFAAGVEQRFDEARAADSAMINFTDLEASWFHDLKRVPLGSVIDLRPGAERQLNTYYDLARVRPQKLDSIDTCIARTGELLDEAVRVTMAPFRRPGATLSGGLDSPQVAVRALAQLPPGQCLPTFTFHPEDGWDGITDHWANGNERPMVEAFAEMHPGIEPHFTTNQGYGHDHRWNDLFQLMGAAPSGLCNVYVYHGLFEAARKEGCDVLLMAEWGNFTFSDKGDWAFVEYFLTGRWLQLWQALKRNPHDDRSMLRRFIAKSLVPLLPNRLWKLLMRLWHPKEQRRHDLMIPLRADYRRNSGAEQRNERHGFLFDRYQPRSRAHARKLLFINLDGYSAEVYQAFEQLYGVPCRDPMAYRPFVEFCFGLPTEVFVRGGEMRWLAKQLAKGIMPEQQRRNRLNGRWDADWHLRIKRRREDYLEQLDRIEDDERLNAMIDVPRLRAALEDFPAHTLTDEQKYFPIEYTLMRGLLTARFIQHIEGRN